MLCIYTFIHFHSVVFMSTIRAFPKPIALCFWKMETATLQQLLCLLHFIFIRHMPNNIIMVHSKNINLIHLAHLHGCPSAVECGQMIFVKMSEYQNWPMIWLRVNFEKSVRIANLSAKCRSRQIFFNACSKLRAIATCSTLTTCKAPSW